MTIDQLIGYCRLLMQFQQVERQLLLPSGERNENDVEHSYSLAMTAWYIVSTCELELDLHLVITYALAHDLIEVYAGDTYFLDTTKALSKVARERAALAAIEQNYPNFEQLHASLEHYEQQIDAESRFVYALDKLLPVIICYLGEGKSWHRDGITWEMLKQNKDEKVAASAVIAELWDELSAKLAELPELFPK